MDAGHPVLGTWICSAEVRGDVVTRNGTHQLSKVFMKLFTALEMEFTVFSRLVYF